uniref:Uncharacterized protein n=1 Tax=Arundo donax TaxID=35708 RepID=A0A0A9EIQ6_ARUDO
MGRELMGLMAAASAREARGGGASGEALPSSVSAPAAGSASASASEAAGAAEPSESELASGVRERRLGLLGLGDAAAGFGGAGRWSASES